MPILVLRFALNVDFGKSTSNNEDWTMLTIREISTPSPVNVLIVTNDTKKDDMRGRELPSISNADSGVSMMMASVSKTDPATEVTKKIFNTCHMK
mmetsp:Transcript_2577/g.5526  ORF Transcript_2577/g.5526 Transcript_2577/m.5526 type:complete len:95 (-) Transcript_2577:2441-2725(-)